MNMPAAQPSSSMPVWRRIKRPNMATARVIMPVCLAGGLLMPSNAAWSTLCYIILLPTVAARLWQGWRPDWHDRLFTAMLALCGWSCLAILWDHNISRMGNSHTYWLVNGICTFAFLLGFKMADGDDPGFRRRAVSVLIGAGAVNALLSVAILLAEGKLGTRMQGWGATLNPVLGTAMLDICILLALGRMAEGKRQGIYIAALVSMALYLMVSYSRTPLVALVCALGIICLGSWKLCGRLALAGLCVVLATLLVWWLQPGIAGLLANNFLARGTDCHVTIWRTAWGLILQNPVVGYGPSARLPIAPHGFCPAYPSPHNLYLSLLLYSGLVGFLLFWLCQWLLWRHLRQVSAGFTTRLWLAVMVVPLVSGLSDLTQVIKGPAPGWYIIWVPMLLVMSLRAAPPR